MKILSLDTATKTGWCLRENGRIIESGVENFAPRRGESPGMRFLRFRGWLRNVIISHKPDLLAYEQAHHRGGAATEVCVGLTTRVVEAGAEFDIECTNLRTHEVKSGIVGKGKAGKGAIIEAVEMLTGIKCIDDNHADAIAIGIIIERDINPQKEMA
jgi:Holliday junction resolvasome RuvABC endonuclease subunit